MLKSISHNWVCTWPWPSHASSSSWRIIIWHESTWWDFLHHSKYEFPYFLFWFLFIFYLFNPHMRWWWWWWIWHTCMSSHQLFCGGLVNPVDISACQWISSHVIHFFKFLFIFFFSFFFFTFIFIYFFSSWNCFLLF